MLRLYVEIYHRPQRCVIPIILVPISRSPAGANATKGKSEMGTQRSGLIGNKEKGSWLERTTSLSIECAGQAGALSPLLLVPLVGALGFVFQHGELDLPLHVVNAVNDHANFVADGVGLL